ncbi:tRNA uridine-5-carboxymethylaminomethyl(34) synthesis GTPase MnmE [Sphingomicrobium nitratireducens]|uniref:tRNA uridine-5-carboxymethylaminomethyl(34) synthesis GTPase MnmE n=1 Tax=Sphingomicrobium nitratireducens TaxID=2964666 RepID=UPI002240C752|nr:tRNA uridine-5-carboxymethylaminomethyl(34) synthesis GTPase MnmE [Sphingomicrobium nitratireducens]
MTARPRDTIVALSSGRLPAAIAVVRMSGPDAPDIACRVAGSLPSPRHASLKVLRDPADGTAIDEAVTLFFPAPDTATGENIVEFQCHGSNAVVRKLLDVLTSSQGCRAAEPGEFTRRALENGRIDLTAAEGLADLLAAETEAQRRSALRIARGGLHDRLVALRERLIDASARAEAAIDYVGDDLETGDEAGRLGGLIAQLQTDARRLAAAPCIETLREGIRVVVAGPTNAGKSSFINYLAGHSRVIVSDVHGTTRDIVEVPLSIGGIPFTLIDTAGLRETDDVVERIGIERTGGAVEDADILVWMGDPESPPDHPRTILVSSKADLRSIKVVGSLPFSAKTGEGYEGVIDAIIAHGSSLIPTSDQIGLTNWQAAILDDVARTLVVPDDIVLQAESIRHALACVDVLMGGGDVDTVLDRLFGRFCLGK